MQSSLHFIHFYLFYLFYLLTLDKDKCRSFLEGLNLPSLTQEDNERLGESVTLAELKNAVAGMKKGRSPGWDGINPEVCLAFWEELGQYLLAMIHKAIDVGAFF